MSAVTTGWQVRPMTEDDEPAVRELLVRSMGDGPTGERTPEFFAWKHRDNVFGPSPGILAVHGDRVVGVRLFLRWQLAWGGRTLRAVRAVDTATHPEFARQGIFTTLTRALLAELEDAGDVDLVFNTPNASSRGGYLKMGWQPVGDLRLHVGTVHPVRLLRGLRDARRASAGGSAEQYAAVEAAPPRAVDLPVAAAVWSEADAVAGMLEQAAPSPAVHTPRSVAYLRWRYAAPGLDYRCVPVHRDGRLVGVGLGRVRSRAGLTELTLGDVLTRPGDVDAGVQVLRRAARSGVDHVVLHAGTAGLRAAAARARFLRAPRVGIALVANPRTDLGPAVLDPSAWELSLGDVEVF